MRWLTALWWGFWATVSVLFEEHKAARRVLLGWAMWILTLLVLRATEVEVLKTMSAPAATFLGAVVGILTTVLAFYVKSREREDRKNGHS